MITRSGTRLMHGTNLAPSLINTAELGPICDAIVRQATHNSRGFGSLNENISANKADSRGTYHIVKIRFDGDRCPLSLVLTDHLPDHHPTHRYEEVHCHRDGRVQLAAYA